MERALSRTLRSESSIGLPRSSRVLPDGCIDILFDFGGSPFGGGSAHVIGAMRTAREVALSGAATCWASDSSPAPRPPSSPLPQTR